MFSNYFKTAFRNLWKRKGFSFLNIIGLSIGIACAALIFLWVEDELTYNDYFKNKNTLFQVMTNQTYDGETFTFASTPGLLAPTIKTEIPGIKYSSRVTWGDRIVFTTGDKSLYADGIQVDSSFVNMFNLELISGSVDRPFPQIQSILINERLALKLFNSLDVVGKTIKYDNKEEYIVSGVYKSLPKNARFQSIDWLISFENFLRKNDWLKYWGNNGVQTYVQLNTETDPVQVNAKLKNFIKSKQEDAIAQPLLLAANDWRLRSEFKEGKQSGGRIKYVKLFSLIAWIILFLACINFMNLATARSEQRAREVGVRKVMGSGKSMLIGQFLIEAIVMSFLAVLLSILLVVLVLPAFNHLVEKELLLNLFKPIHLIGFFSIGLICGIVAGSYPAFYLSSFSPIKVLKGLKLPSAASVAFIRKGLVMLQFVISIGLIICTLVIYTQIMHVRTRDIGLNKSNLIYVDQQILSVAQNGNVGARFSSIRNELLNTGVVEEASLTNSKPFEVGSNTANISWKGKDPSKQILISLNWATHGYLKTMGLKLMEGRDFYPSALSDSNNVIINETMAKLVDKDISKVIGASLDYGGQNVQIIGVIKDYVYNDMYGSSAPLVLFNDANGNITTRMQIRYKKGVDYKEALAKTEAVMKANNPNFPFEYQFVDQEFDALFKSESLIGTLAGVFAGLAIFISCLGLFGLAAFIAEKRTREIGIRKILGASVMGLTALLSRNFLLLVVLSCLFAFPLSWWIMHSWLQGYEYRVSLSWWMFALPALLAIVIALLTVSFQAIKAALMNPIKSIRTE